MKLVAKQNFARFSSAFIGAAALLILASFIASLPTYISSMPSSQQVQDMMTKTSEVLSKGTSSNTSSITQLLDVWSQTGASSTTSSSTFTLLLCLSLLLLLGVMVLQVGMSHLALVASSGGSPKFKDFFAPLKHFGRWLGLWLWMLIRVYLWMFLFIIPGIIAALRYSQAVYLMLEDPEMGINKALKLSGELMRGYKWQLFVLDVSFILWYLLAGFVSWLFTFNFVGLYFIPYLALTQVQFYYDLRREHPIEGLPPTMAFAVEMPAASQPPLPPQPPTNPPV